MMPQSRGSPIYRFVGGGMQQGRAVGVQQRFDGGGMDVGGNPRMQTPYGACNATNFEPGEPYDAIQAQPGKPTMFPLTHDMFVVNCAILLFVISVLPAWDAVSLLRDFNFIFWQTSRVPIITLLCLILCIVVLCFSMELSSTWWSRATSSMQNFTSVLSVYVSAVGLVLIISSATIYHGTVETHNTILFQCHGSQETRELQMHYQSLLNLRQSVGCIDKYSIQECRGFDGGNLYTQYLEKLESDFRCTGFCHERVALFATLNTSSASSIEGASSPSSGAAIVNGSERPNNMSVANGTNATSLLARSRRWKPSQSLFEGTITVGASAESSRVSAPKTPGVPRSLPPALFSKATFQLTCDGAAARQLMNLGNGVAEQGWYIGVTLVTISLAMGLWEWGGDDTK
eukprot:TRINITY_DN1244_c0_g1_i3.p1 TRINITY_DN1244_c0_g1~~TRINITY_DN1244_c0_g1_i3.p1  ORF type:complete len:401 (+),score=46.04 TRINITY_DN1244_c0_g1_i3:79-1281(+)